MKLHELGARRPTEQIARVIENQAGRKIDFDSLTSKQARVMLSKVRGMLSEHRDCHSFHHSEKNPTYLQLMMIEQALAVRIKEQAPGAPVAIDVNDPKTKQTLQKAEKGQTLTPDEQKTMNAIALMKKESRRGKRMVKEQSDLQQAQVVLAAQDMVDRIQGMIEDISEMQFKDLPALSASIKNDVGTEQASQFQAQATTAFTNLLQSLQSGKTELEAAQAGLTGQAPVVPGQDDAGLDIDATADVDGEVADVDTEVNLGDLDDEQDEEEPGTTAALGRERR